jgi:hypothetical protein
MNDIIEQIKTLNISFVGIDFWSRPVYKVEDMNVYIGSLDTLFPDAVIAPNGSKEEIDTYFKTHIEELVIFGNSFDDDQDPLGTKIKKNIKLNIL